MNGGFQRVYAFPINKRSEGNETETYMVPITREEKELLKKKYPDLCVARTMKQDSKRKHYYCEERAGAMAYLEKIRMRGVRFDSRYPDGKPPAQEERRTWNGNGQNGKRDSRGRNGRNVNSAEYYKAAHPRGTDRFGGRD